MFHLRLLVVVAPTLGANGGSVQEGESASYQEGFVNLADDVGLFYRSYGDRMEPLVLLHGGPGGNFMGVGPDLVPLSKHRRLLLYDQRGGGRSTLGRSPDAISVESHVADLDALRKHLKIQRMVLVGHSWGALLAAFYAAQYPQHVARAILIGPMEPTRTLFEKRLEVLAQRDPEGADELAALREREDLKNDPLALCRASAVIIQRRYYFDPTKMKEKQGDYCAVPPDAPARAELAYRYTWESLRRV